jgi:hypothetical protein
VRGYFDGINGIDFDGIDGIDGVNGIPAWAKGKVVPLGLLMYGFARF